MADRDSPDTGETDPGRPGSELTVVRITVTGALADAAADVLWLAGTPAVAEENLDGGEVALTAQVPSREVNLLRDWCARVAGDAAIATVEEVEVDPAWADAWVDHAQAYRVGPLLVRPVWVDEHPRTGEIDVVLDPGPTFGTGSHPSTRGVLAALVEQVRGGERVLDVGSGSGVLSVAALLLGADRALGVDTDHAADSAGVAAAALAGVSNRFEFRYGSIEAADDGYDLVMINMLIGALESVGPEAVRRSGPAATLILGGFLESQRDRALAAVRPAGVVDEFVEDGWVTLVTRLG